VLTWSAKNMGFVQQFSHKPSVEERHNFRQIWIQDPINLIEVDHLKPGHVVSAMSATRKFDIHDPPISHSQTWKTRLSRDLSPTGPGPKQNQETHINGSFLRKSHMRRVPSQGYYLWWWWWWMMSMTMTKYAGDCWRRNPFSGALPLAIAGVFRSHSPMHRASDLHHHE
jgi:hypothetical protein